MKVTMTEVLLGFNDKPIENEFTETNEAGEKVKVKKSLLVRDVFCAALNAQGPEYHREDLKKKTRKGQLALCAYIYDVLEVTNEDAVMIKEMVGMIYPPVVLFRIENLLEGRYQWEGVKRESPPVEEAVAAPVEA